MNIDDELLHLFSQVIAKQVRTFLEATVNAHKMAQGWVMVSFSRGLFLSQWRTNCEVPFRLLAQSQEVVEGVTVSHRLVNVFPATIYLL